MTIRVFTIILTGSLLLFSPQAKGQNLVSNGGFELDSFCGSWGPSRSVAGWHQVRSADFYHMKCLNVSLPNGQPHKGRGAVGLYNGGFIFPPIVDTMPSREYVYTRLLTPLKKGKWYTVSFWTRPSAFRGFNIENNSTTDNISLAFFSDTADLTAHKVPPDNITINLPPDLTNSNGVLHNTQEYTLVEGCYQADGTEAYLIIGNFSPLFQTNLEPIAPDASVIYPYSYFMIDEVEVREVFQPDFPEDTLLCDGDSSLILLPDSLWETTFFWDGLELSSTQIPVHEGTHQLTIETGACQVTQSIYLAKEPCNSCQLFLPNVFSPNDDGINDHLVFTSNCTYQLLEAAVFNRWGEQIFFSTSGFNWDGSIQGTRRSAMPGNYVYVLKVLWSVGSTPKTEVISGDITLIR